jgi:uncharacterized protein
VAAVEARDREGRGVPRDPPLGRAAGRDHRVLENGAHRVQRQGSQWLGGSKDAEGNQCTQDRICRPDNLRYVDSIRTLLIGEDTGRRNNNCVWAFNVDTRRLSRILSAPMAAEATGLTAVANTNGFAYIMSNVQHPGEGGLPSYTGADRAEVLAQIESKWGGRKKSAIGYIGTKTGALPAFK